MKKKLFLVVLVLILAIFLSGCDLNLMGQERFTVDGYVYGLDQGGEELGEEGWIVMIGLGRIGAPTQESDADIISQVSGIVIVNPEGVSVGVAEVTYDPYQGHQGQVLIWFETSGQSGPWTLIWPGYDPVQITGPEEPTPPPNDLI